MWRPAILESGRTHLTSDIDPIELTQTLIRIPTVNPPGDEDQCARWLAGFLQEQGFSARLHTFGPRRFNLVAEWVGQAAGPGWDSRAIWTRCRWAVRRGPGTR